MSEPGAYRRDPLTGDWMIIAPARLHVSRAIRAASPPTRGPALPPLLGSCPFCPGNEALTAHITSRVPAEGPWRVRTVRNKYSAVLPQQAAPAPAEGAAAAPAPGSGLRLESLPAEGLQEVIIDGPEHDLELPDLPRERLVELFGVYRDRLAFFEAMEGIAQVSLFRNRGLRSGSSQPHPHGQVAASAVLGSIAERRWARALAHHERTGRRLLEDLLEAELRAKARVLHETESLVALMPFAPHHPYETWIVPRRPESSFSLVSEATLGELAALFAPLLPALLEASGRYGHNLVWRLPPVHARAHPAAAWHLELLPRGGCGGGLELSTGFTLLGISPERAAGEVREALDRGRP